MDNKYIAKCGLDCKKCEAYIATQNDDNTLREKVAKEWSALNSVEIKPEWINCDGCNFDGRKSVFCNDICEIRKCALGKKFATCGECISLNECAKLRAILDNNPDALSNLKK